MWLYYRDHKTELVEGVKECREIILGQIMEGIAVEQVFAPFLRTQVGGVGGLGPRRRVDSARRRSA